MVYKSPLDGWTDRSPLPEGFNDDGKSLINPKSTKLSGAYDAFPDPIDKANNGFDFHIYYMAHLPEQAQFARELHERVRREFPELRIYRLFDRPIGPHTSPMFEVNTFTPAQTGAFFSWLVVNRGPCSVLVHPNTGDAYKDHTELMTWIGQPWPLNGEILKRLQPH